MVITQIVLNFFADMLASLLGAVPPLPASISTMLSNLPGQVNSLTTAAGNVGPVIPWTMAGVCLALVLTCWVVAFGIDLVRRIISYATLGGGAV